MEWSIYLSAQHGAKNHRCVYLLLIYIMKKCFNIKTHLLQVIQKVSKVLALKAKKLKS